MKVVAAMMWLDPAISAHSLLYWIWYHLANLLCLLCWCLSMVMAAMMMSLLLKPASSAPSLLYWIWYHLAYLLCWCLSSMV